MINARTRTLGATAVALALSATLVGCSGGNEGPSATPTASVSSTPAARQTQPNIGPVGPTPSNVNSDPGSVPEPQPSGVATGDDSASTSASPNPSSTEVFDPEVKITEDEAIIKAAKGFITARETKFSHNRQSPLDWLEEAKPFMTKAAYDRLKSEINPEGTLGSEWNVAHDEGYAISPSIEKCGFQTAPGDTGPNTKIVLCDLTNKLVDKEGKPVPIHKIPADWLSVGPQDVPLLVMVREGDKWLVDQDVTGMAS